MLPLLLVFAPVSLEAQGRRAGSQEDRDSLVRLISADMARLVEVDGQQYRKVVGNAVFLHNGTYLRCDSAYWNVSGEYIDAKGHIRIEQDGTLLTGDSIKYDIPSNTARFRGHLVELIDRDSNILRTNYLDYNTKDSTAFFYRGGAMKDADGNLIESVTGRYSSPDERFDFIGQVEMFSDSLFFVCDSLEYNTGNEVAVFRGSTRGWYGDNEISAGAGRYERTVEKFYFRRDVHILTAEYELWCDTLYYDRAAEYSRLLGNVQLLDTVDNALALAGELRFWNSPRRAELYREPALVLVNEEEGGARDSIFMASDFMLYYTKRMFEIDSAVVAEARQRYESAQVDPLEQKKSKDAAGRSSGGAAGRQLKSSGGGGASAVMKSPGTLPMPYGPYEDTLSVADTVAVPPPPDTTEVSFLEAYHNVRIFKSDIQVKCDSLLFGSIDSIVRLYTAPVLWYEIKSQITADSMQFLMSGEALDKGFLYSNAFVISEEEDGKYYHQIKSPEMIGYFDGSQISRFDALGGVTAMFYLAEDSVITTMNRKECRLMTGRLKDGELQRILYMENVKSDAYPVGELTPEDSRLRDFNWTPELRPATRYDVTLRGVRPSRRAMSVPSPYFPEFKFSAKYFEGYMEGIIEEIDSRKPLIWVER